MGDTSISWTDKTWNPMRGCSRTIASGASQSGCGDPTGGGCYAERNGYRFAGPGLAYEGLVRMTPHGARWTGKVLLVDEHLLDPLRWERPRKIFTTSVSDPFHERFSNETIAVVVGVMAATRRHTHQMLTKRARRMPEWFAWVAREAAEANGGRGMSIPAFCFAMLQKYVAGNIVFTEQDRKLLARADVVEAALSAEWPLPNLWPMTSVENQAAAEERIPPLLETPAAVRGLSCEPLLGEVDLDIPRCSYCDSGAEDWGLADDGATPWCLGCDSERSYGHWLHLDGGIDWVIAGCESGPGARPMDVAWARSLRDQCKRAGVAYFLKQAVEQAGAMTMVESRTPLDADYVGECPRVGPMIPTIWCGPTSHRKAGNVIELPYLDGAQHASFPKEQP